MMYSFLNEFEKKYDIKLTISKEEVPLGTGGPIGLAKSILEQSQGNEIFIFNSDITCTFPLKDMLDFHRKHGKEGTIAVTKVKDPSKFGVILSDEKRKILNFIEKPSEWIGDNINAGLYVFNKSFLSRVNPVPTSIEREIFPQMAKDEQLYSFPLEGFWADIGQPRDFLRGAGLHLEDLKQKESSLLSQSNSDKIVGNVVIDPSSQIEEGSLIGPNVVIGPKCLIKKGVRIKNSIVLEGVEIQEHSYINGSIIGWRSKIGKWVRIDELSVFGEEVAIGPEVNIKNCIILPNVVVKTDPKEGSTLLF